MDGLILKDSPASSTASSNGISSEKEFSVKLSAHLRIFSTRAPIFFAATTFLYERALFNRLYKISIFGSALICVSRAVH